MSGAHSGSPVRSRDQPADLAVGTSWKARCYWLRLAACPRASPSYLRGQPPPGRNLRLGEAADRRDQGLVIRPIELLWGW